jgi:hypothetical protein
MSTEKKNVHTIWPIILIGLILMSSHAAASPGSALPWMGSEKSYDMQLNTSSKSPQSSLDYIAWKRCLNEVGNIGIYSGSDCVQQAVDGGYIVAALSSNSQCSAETNHDTLHPDFGVLKLNSKGEKMWHKCLGGSYIDQAQSIQKTTDGGYVIAGDSRSTDGDLGGCANAGDFANGCVVKLDSLGNIVWKKCLGGSNQDKLYSVSLTSDGGYIVAGSTTSKDGDISGWHEGYGSYNNPTLDGWIVKLDSSGNIVWQKCLGGSRNDEAKSIKQTRDGGYIVAGSTTSKDGDISDWHEGYGSYNDPTLDGWIAKLDSSGNIVWQKCLGGSRNDEAKSIIQTSEGGYIVVGYTKSSIEGWHDGTDQYNQPTSDCLVVKLDGLGNIEWQRCLGGSNEERASNIQQTKDGNYIIAGSTISKNGDVKGWHVGYNGNMPTSDCWIFKLSSNGALLWNKCIGGSGNDAAISIQQTKDEGYIMVGDADSTDGDLSGNSCSTGGFWMAKIRDDSYICYSNLPRPDLAYVSKTDYTVNGNDFTRYRLDVTNKNDYPANLFKAAPDLPPCGLNKNASRTWVRIYDQNNKYIYGFCALSSPSDLGKIWFAVPKGSKPYDRVYVTLVDRRCDPALVLRSNVVTIK